jgi:hypothetical protein
MHLTPLFLQEIYLAIQREKQAGTEAAPVQKDGNGDGKSHPVNKAKAV